MLSITGKPNSRITDLLDFDPFKSTFTPISGLLRDEPDWTMPVFDETKNSYVLEVDLPGIKKEDVSIETEGKYLKIEAERKGKRAMTYKRAFRLPEHSTDNVVANMDNGVLTLTIEKSAASKAKKIEITGSS